MQKQCSKCKLVLSTNMFCANKNTISKLQSNCKKCQLKYQKSTKGKESQARFKQTEKWKKSQERYNKSDKAKENSRKRQIKYRATEKGKEKKEEYHKLGKRHEVQKKYREKDSTKTYMREYKSVRIKIDINFRLAERIRTRIRNAIKNNFKAGSAVRDLGCTIDELKIHLEKQFKEGMSWGNWTRIDLHESAWNIDHIIPLSKFNLTDREQFLKACHYTNLQPLWALENIIKSNKI